MLKKLIDTMNAFCAYIAASEYRVCLHDRLYKSNRLSYSDARLFIRRCTERKIEQWTGSRLRWEIRRSSLSIQVAKETAFVRLVARTDTSPFSVLPSMSFPQLFFIGVFQGVIRPWILRAVTLYRSPLGSLEELDVSVSF